LPKAKAAALSGNNRTLKQFFFSESVQ
jgi:hypothetical protein